jgi:hypothetical protein
MFSNKSQSISVMTAAEIEAECHKRLARTVLDELTQRRNAALAAAENYDRMINNLPRLLLDLTVETREKMGIEIRFSEDYVY